MTILRINAGEALNRPRISAHGDAMANLPTNCDARRCGGTRRVARGRLSTYTRGAEQREGSLPSRGAFSFIVARKTTSGVAMDAVIAHLFDLRVSSAIPPDSHCHLSANRSRPSGRNEGVDT